MVQIKDLKITQYVKLYSEILGELLQIIVLRFRKGTKNHHHK